MSECLSPRHLSSPGSYALYLSSLGDPTGSSATADLSLRVTGTHKPLHHDKMETAVGRFSHIVYKKSSLPSNQTVLFI
jgi:hypothetical protein